MNGKNFDTLKKNHVITSYTGDKSEVILTQPDLKKSQKKVKTSMFHLN